MKKIRRKLIRWGIGFLIVLGLFFYGIKLYFTHVHPIKPQLEAKVAEVEKALNVDHPLKNDQIPEMYKKAVIATEDRRFAWDPGIDPIGILRSVQVDLTKHQLVQGGSTITQQLVDNTFLKRSKSFDYKLKQSLYAIGIYDTVSKTKVFTMYTNIIYFGHGAYGLYNASKTYFDKTPDQLNAGELALLAGIPNSPNNYDPFKNLKLSIKRQKVVVMNMVEMGVITQEEAQTILNLPLRFASNKK
ncbi:transglycosylase domain-containing protein [Pullulanibacillus sp. KACC 23026]|uniref:biosynthetic peptidoglycan transglycosylase n=1 Tax=Pullulanibacillus sp. KACC 23026 TaxID=3028315 RepID=UPI0023B15AA4|nr:biosynthetic peptidoglycan transglycosylase [Pullulanibacillus sp. KACC 23026]WEG11802.1 transglycosylase domain-containing protein [Pullulanibacillus sp. KACC 23026]